VDAAISRRWRSSAWSKTAGPTILTRAAAPEVYLSFWQNGAFSKDLVVRMAADPLSVAAGVQRELRLAEPTVAVENIRTLDDIRRTSLTSRSFAMQLLVGFSIVGTALTLVGIFGVISLSVASRRREIAIRAALGGPWGTWASAIGRGAGLDPLYRTGGRPGCAARAFPHVQTTGGIVARTPLSD
jgi:hypothetical protein